MNVSGSRQQGEKKEEWYDSYSVICWEPDEQRRRGRPRLIEEEANDDDKPAGHGACTVTMVDICVNIYD